MARNTNLNIEGRSSRLMVFVHLVVFMIICPLQAEAEPIKVWVKTFIPGDVSGSQKVPNAAGTMISIPLVNQVIGCFDTDNRSFDSKLNASARVTAAVSSLTQDGEPTFQNECGISTKRDCASGKMLATGSCKANDVVKSAFKQVDSATRRYTFIAAAGNPLVLGAPAIDFDVTVTERWEGGRPTFTATGKVDSFPAFEAYVQYGVTIKELFKIGPKDGAGPGSLVGGPNREVSGTAKF